MRQDDETLIDDAVLTAAKKDLPQVDDFHISDDHHDDHVDERWLVSYADMMTLLFGLFVMLYALQDPVQFEKMKNSVSEKFSSQEEAIPQPDFKKLLEEQILKVKAQELALTERLSELEQVRNELKQLRLDNLDLQKTVETANTERSVASVKEQKNQDLQLEIDQLKAELKAARVPSTADTKMKAMAQKIQQQEEQIRENQELEKKIEDLTKKFEDEKARSKPNKNFLAIIVNWPTSDHDLDLVVQDPTGKTFDFKKRSFAKHPGAFALDTRRGPGTEVWQTESLIPGKYKVKVIFYNQYGNKSATKAQLTLFSSYGKTEVPEFNLDITGNRSKELQFEVQSDGKVLIL